jgi:hypothetical protein
MLYVPKVEKRTGEAPYAQRFEFAGQPERGAVVAAVTS